MNKKNTRQKENKGITLIALVITIIVMLILVAVTISMAVNGGLFDQAGKAAGQTKNALSNEQKLANGGFSIGEQSYTSINEYFESQQPKLIPEGATYYDYELDQETGWWWTVTKTYGQGEAFPAEATVGDIFYTSGVNYCYGFGYNWGGFDWKHTYEGLTTPEYEGWYALINAKTSTTISLYGEILGVPVVTLVSGNGNPYAEDVLTSVYLPESVEYSLAALSTINSLEDIYYPGSEAEFLGLTGANTLIRDGLTIHYNYAG